MELECGEEASGAAESLDVSTREKRSRRSPKVTVSVCSINEEGDKCSFVSVQDRSGHRILAALIIEAFFLLLSEGDCFAVVRRGNIRSNSKRKYSSCVRAVLKLGYQMLVVELDGRRQGGGGRIERMEEREVSERMKWNSKVETFRFSVTGLQ